MKPRTRHLARTGLVRSAAVVALAGGALSACSALSPQTTKLQYDPADGVSATLNGVVVRDLVVVGQDGKGTIAAGLANETNDPVNVTVEAQGGQATIAVPPMGSVNLASKGTQVSVQGKPGTTETIKVSTDKGASATLKAPVVAPQGAYATVTPGASGGESSSSSPSSPATGSTPTPTTPTVSTSAAPPPIN